MGEGLLGPRGASFVEHFLGQRFGHALHYYFVASYLAGAFGYSLGQLPDVAVGGIKQNQRFHGVGGWVEKVNGARNAALMYIH